MLKIRLRSVSFLLMALCIFSVSIPVAYADEITDEPAAEIEVISDSAEESSEAADETETTEESTEETEEAEPVEGEITDAQYKAYVLGCLFFFVAVTLFYFSYKLFAMFF